MAYPLVTGCGTQGSEIIETVLCYLWEMAGGSEGRDTNFGGNLGIEGGVDDQFPEVEELPVSDQLKGVDFLFSGSDCNSGGKERVL